MATENDTPDVNLENENEVAELIDEVVPDVEVQPEQEQPEEATPAPKYKPQQKAQPAKSDLAKQRQADREAGRTSFKEMYEKKAKALGFGSLDEMFQKRPAQGQPSGQKPQTDNRSAKQISDLEEQVRTLRAEIRSLEGKVRHWRSQCENLQNEMVLRHDAYLAEVDPEEVDAVLSKLDGHFKRLPDAKRKEFDHNEFFKELKAKKPAYFRQYIQTPEKKEVPVEEVPANTAPAGSAPKPSPKEIKEQVTPETTERKHAMKMSSAEFREYARSQGLDLGDM